MDFKKIEKKWQIKWKKAKIFEANISPRSGPKDNKGKFFITTPYPYISGSLHIGHGRAVVETDVFARYKRMAGFNVLFPMAFHISGTPVLGISLAIKKGDKKKIQLYTNYVKNYVKSQKKIKKIIKSFSDPMNIVKFFIPKMIDEYSSLGLSIDWSRSFTSGDPIHQALVTWQFQKYKEKNLLTKADHFVLYCIDDKNAVGEDDIQDGDTSPVEKQEFTIIKFELEDKIVPCATLRPETMFGATNLWIDPHAVYELAQIEIKNKIEIWLLSEQAIEKLKHQGKKILASKKIKGKELIGKIVKNPLTKAQIPILPAVFTDQDIGTGIVVSVPSDAPFDYVALEDLKKDKKLLKSFKLNIKNIQPIPIIETNEFGNSSAKKAIEKFNIKNQADSNLEKATQFVYKIGFHTGRLNKNCGKYAEIPVKQAKDIIKSELLNKNLADIIYETSRKANCRCGGKIIVAQLKDQWFLDFNANNWKQTANHALKNIHIVPELYRKQFEDTFKWLDRRPCARKKGLGTELPFEKGWMIESLSDSTIYMTLYTISHLIRKFKIKQTQLNQEFFDYIFSGKFPKIQKNQLNKLKEEFEYWYPIDQRHTHTAHLSNHLSFFIFAHAALFPEKYWPKKISFHGMVLSQGAKMSKSKGNVISLLDIKNKYSSDLFRAYLCSSVSVDSNFDWKDKEAFAIKKNLNSLYSLFEKIIKNKSKKNLPKQYSWFYSKFESYIKQATQEIEQMHLREYSNIILYDIIGLYKKLAVSCKSSELKIINYYFIKKYIKLLSPLCPHMAEELWSKFNKTFVSLEKWPEVQESLIDKNAEKSIELIEKVSEDINHILKILNKKIKTIYLYPILSELENLKNAESFFKKQFNCKIKIYPSNKPEHDPEEKAKKSKPGKPGIYLE